MSWPSDKANEAFSGNSVTADVMRRMLEEAARRARGVGSHADRQDIVDAIEDMLVDADPQQPEVKR